MEARAMCKKLVVKIIIAPSLSKSSINYQSLHAPSPLTSLLCPVSFQIKGPCRLTKVIGNGGKGYV